MRHRLITIILAPVIVPVWAALWAWRRLTCEHAASGIVAKVSEPHANPIWKRQCASCGAEVRV